MTRTRARGPRGFTLLELLVSIGLVALLVAAMAAFLNDALRIRARIGDSIERGVSADAAIDEIERALQTCVVDDGALGVGVRGSATQLDILHAGIAAWRLGSEDPERAFAPLERLTVSFDEGGRRLLLARGNGPLSPLPGEIGRVRFRYHDGTRWSNSFDSGNAERLPLAVEVSIWFRVAEDRTAAAAPEVAAADAGDAETDTGADTATADDALAEEDDERGPAPDRRRVIAIPDALVGGAP
ncbi:MAG: prepilin-type N-terminal cleavage/methylation domain-containing protein [Phycisphaerae bacterium]|nr:prepilin-type N-terminal cleavage/methylation domain-containing protein [Phycisphaerae bacterium]